MGLKRHRELDKGRITETDATMRFLSLNLTECEDFKELRQLRETP